MKRITYIALMLLLAVVTASAQKNDVTYTKSGASSGTTVNYVDGVTFKSTSSSLSFTVGTTTVNVAHTERYDFALTTSTTINGGDNGNLPDDNEIWAGAKPRRAVASQKMVQNGPALILSGPSTTAIYHLSDNAGTVSIKRSGDNYIVTGSGISNGQATLSCSSVTSIYLSDPHIFDDVNDPDHFSCTQCAHTFIYYEASKENKYFLPTFLDKTGSSLNYTNSFDSEAGKGVVEIEGVVTVLGYSSFASYEGLTSIKLPNTITTIGESAFRMCTSLECITFPSSVTSIGKTVFSGCASLEDVAIMGPVKSIGFDTFHNCTNLKLITIASPTVTSYAFTSFDERTCKTKLRVPSSLVAEYKKTYPWSRFEDIRCISHDIKHVDTSTASCGSGYKEHWGCQYCDVVYADAECKKETTIQDIAIFGTNHQFSDGDDSKCTACGNTFIYYEASKEFGISNSFLDKDDLALAFHNSFDEENGEGVIEVSGEVNTILDAAFNGKNDLISMKLPNTITSIGDYAFYRCTSLNSIVIPSSVTSIGKYAFDDCTSLESINIPNSVTSIEDGTFYSCAGLKNITIPSSVTSIEEYAFADCTSLKSIVIPSSVTSIGEYAFAYCENLTDITIASPAVLDWEECMFTNTTSFILRVPSSLVASYRSADGWKDIRRICCITHTTTHTDEVPAVSCASTRTLENWHCEICNFYFTDAECKHDVPVEGLTASAPLNMHSFSDGDDSKCTACGHTFVYYEASKDLGIYNCFLDKDEQALTFYNSFDEENGEGVIEINGEVKYISNNAFVSRNGLISMKLPNTITSISNYAFYYCENLKSIDIPNSVTSIGICAFDGCFSLKSINIPSSVTSIGKYAFNYCTSLESINIPNSVTSIGDGAFYECTSLKSIIIPSSVTSIGEYAFDYCTSLESIVIPSSVTSIGEYAFANCEKLTDITIESTTMLEWKPAMFTYHRYSTLRVPSSLVAEYKSADGWKNFRGIYCITHPEIVNDQCNVCGEEVDPIQNGDINGDGKFTIEDLALLINILNGKATDTFGTADVYPDKKLDMKDVETLKDLILGKKVTRAYTKLFNEYFAPVVTQIDIEQVDGECPDGAFRMNDAGTVWVVPNNGDYTKICIQTNSPKIELFEAKNLFKSFSRLTSINGLDMLDVSCVSDLSGMFYYCAVKSLDLSNWDVSNVTNMSAMFNTCMGITTLDLSNWDVSNVTNMSAMFATCNHLTEIKLSNWDVSNVTDMSYLFSGAMNLRSLDLTGWNTSSVTNMNNVFDCTYSLKTLYLGKNFKIPSTTTNFIKVLSPSYEIHCPASLKSQIEALTADCQFKPTIITDVE